MKRIDLPLHDVEVPADDWPYWVRYSSAWELNKRTCCDLAVLPRSTIAALAYLTSQKLTAEMAAMFGVDLIPAPFAHGAGLHVIDPGGRLDCHLDYALHPGCPWLERRVNVVAFLSGDGALQFWDDTATRVIHEFDPIPGTAIVWESNDLAYHSVAPVTKTRATLASYFCAPARPGVVRKRALWVPNRHPQNT